MQYRFVKLLAFPVQSLTSFIFIRRDVIIAYQHQHQSINQSIKPSPSSSGAHVNIMSASIPLPPELSNSILRLAGRKENVNDDCRVDDLSLCSPCNAISWTWNTSTHEPSSSNPSIHLLLRKFLNSPHLCTSIEHLTFSGDPGTIEGIDEGDIKAVENLLRQAQFPLAPLWKNALNLGNINVFVALILSQLSNLQKPIPRITLPARIIPKSIFCLACVDFFLPLQRQSFHPEACCGYDEEFNYSFN